MNLNDIIKTERQNKPPRIVLHGVHGVGKSTWAASAPAPIFLQTEDGLTSIDVAHFPVVTELEQVWQYMEMLISEGHEYKTFVLDTVDWLEKIIWDQVCADHNVTSIEDLGYGKGYVQAMKHWEKFYRGLEKIREKGLAIIILAHNEIKAHNPPDSEAYDRFQIKLHRHAAGKLEEWADLVLFANFVVYIDKKKNETKGKAVGNAERIIHTTNRPAWRAKTRYKLPETLPLDFNKLMEEIKNG